MRKITFAFIFSILGLVLHAQNLIDLSVAGSYATGVFDEGATEIIAHDPASQQVYSTNGDAKKIDILDVSDPTAITLVKSIDLAPYGDQANSVDFHNGFLVAAVEANDFDATGKIVFFDANGNFTVSVEAGVLPDMVTFSPDGNWVLVANEGEPDDDYTADPMGSVSVIDISGGISSLTQANVTTLDFTAFNANYDPTIRNFGPVASFLDTLEDTAAKLGNFLIYDEIGSAGWIYDSFGGDHFAEANGFSSDTITKDWLITYGQNLTGLDSAYFSFYNAKNFSGGSLDVLISTDYDTNSMSSPVMATWDTITSNFTFSTGGYTDVFSGRYSLDQYLKGNVSVAILYQGAPGGGNSALWQIDDISLQGTRPELARNLEPEYIAVAPQSDKAFVICQENNALAVVDLSGGTPTISALKGLGFKDWSTGNNKMDASNKSSSVVFKNWPVFGMYQPDAAKAFEANGNVYLATANEGDSREYNAFDEEARVEDLTLDPTAFPNAANLQMEDSLGRLKITTTLGDTDGDGDFDELYAYGARSFAIWDDQGNLIWDSEDIIAQEVFKAFPNNFNSNNDDNSSLKSRSDDKGIEPEAIEVAEINNRLFAFVGLERMGGVMVFEITNPTSPQFVSYFLNRDFSVNASDPNAGDLAPEDIRFVSGANSPSGSPVLLVSNEVSGTMSIYAIGGSIGLSEEQLVQTLQAYPNPVQNVVEFTQEVKGGILYDINGRKVLEVEGTQANLSALPSGIYTLTTQSGISLQLLKR